MNDSRKSLRHEKISSIIIQNESENCSLKLSPNDCIIPSEGVWISCIYFYHIERWTFVKTKEKEDFLNVNRLILSLRKLIEYYPLLSGSYQIDQKDKRITIVSDEKKGGILFNSYSINIPLSDLTLSINKDTNTIDIDQSIELTNENNLERLFHIRHTRFLCGGVALSIHLNHSIGDAHSYFQLIKDWTRLYQNIEYHPIVCHNRSLLEPIKSLHHIDQQKAYRLKDEISSQSEESIQPIMKIFRFSANELERMKKEATKHLLGEMNFVSTYDVLTSHLYRHVALARHSSFSSSHRSKLCIPINIRSRLQEPKLSWNYFGNAVLHSYFEAESKDLIDQNDLGFWATEIHQTISTMTNEEIQRILAWIVSQEDKSKITFNLPSDDSSFYVTAWNKMDMYLYSNFEDDLQTSRILLPLQGLCNGGAYLFSTEINDNSIDVILILDSITMQLVENNPQFREYA